MAPIRDPIEGRFSKVFGELALPVLFKPREQARVVREADASCSRTLDACVSDPESQRVNHLGRPESRWNKLG